MRPKVIQISSYMSFIVSLVLMSFKFWGYHLTGSQAVFSDAMESIVNVIASGLAIAVILFASKPADQDHPYGHGKIEFFSAAFEGGLIAFAAVLICFEAVRSLAHPHPIDQPGWGLAIVIGSGMANLLLGLYLVTVGKKHHSVALVASGKHVMSDFTTSAGVTIGLVLVAVTKLSWIDPVCALLVGLWLAKTGFELVRESVGGLLDQEDRGLLEHLLKIMELDRPEGIIQVHHCRVMRSGNYHHIDAHAVVPEYWDVAEAHAQMDAFENQLITDYAYDGELHLHMDPCRQAYCRVCDVKACPIRREDFVAKHHLTIEELTSPDEPAPFRMRTHRSDALS